MSVLILDSEAKFYADRLSAAVPSLQYHAASTEKDALAHARDTRVLVGLAPYLSNTLLDAMPKLEWIQALTTGVDNLQGRAGIALTNCHGIHGPQMSELALLQMLALLRRFPDMLDNQRAHRWERRPQALLAGRTVCIVGIGAIAEHLAAVLAALAVDVTGVSDSREKVPGFRQVYPRDQLATAAADADVLVLLTPYTPDTHHLIDATVIGAMKPTALLVNISRGGCLDEAALAAALRAGDIAGAALDVFERSPLLDDDPIWDLPNLIVTPHIGGYSAIYHEQALPILVSNMADYARGGVAALTGRLDR